MQLAVHLSIHSISGKPAGIYLFKTSNGNTRIMCEICSKLIIKTPERRYLSRSGAYIVNFELMWCF